ncbi:MAG: tectonin domain-containing protein [Bacteroidota bacterium]
MKKHILGIALACLLLPCSILHAQYIWKKLPGSALEIASGPEGQIYIVGTGKRVFEWNPSQNKWVALPGLGNIKKIAVLKHNVVVAINTSGKLFSYNSSSRKWDGSNWIAKNPPANIQSIHYSPDPRFKFNSLGDGLKCVSNNKVYEYQNSQWKLWKNERYVRNLVEPKQGTIFYRNTSNKVVRYVGNQKKVLSGTATDISAGNDGSVWVVGTSKRIFKWDTNRQNWNQNSSWDLKENGQQAIKKVAIDTKGFPWVISLSGGIYKRVKGRPSESLTTQNYTIDLKRFCIQNHDEGWGKEEANGNILIYKGTKNKSVSHVKNIFFATDSDPAYNRNLTRTKGQPLLTNGKKVPGVTLDNFAVLSSVSKVYIPNIRQDDFILICAVFIEEDDSPWPVFNPLIEEAVNYVRPHEARSFGDLQNRIRELKERIKNKLPAYFSKNHLAVRDDSDLIGIDIEGYIHNKNFTWPYESGSNLRLHGKNDDAHYFMEFTVTPN